MRPYELNADFVPIRYVHKLNMNGLRDGNSKHLARVGNQAQRGRARQILKRQLKKEYTWLCEGSIPCYSSNQSSKNVNNLHSFTIQGLTINPGSETTEVRIPSSSGSTLLKVGTLAECIEFAQNYKPTDEDEPIFQVLQALSAMPSRVVKVSMFLDNGLPFTMLRKPEPGRGFNGWVADMSETSEIGE